MFLLMAASSTSHAFIHMKENVYIHTKERVTWLIGGRTTTRRSIKQPTTVGWRHRRHRTVEISFARCVTFLLDVEALVRSGVRDSTPDKGIDIGWT